MPYDRMSPLDAGFLHIEDGVTHMHIGSVSIMEGPPPPYELLRDGVAAKLPAVRRYRQVVRHVPLDLGRPVWVDDPYFDIGYHVRHTSLPRPGSRSQLNHLVGRVMARQLDRERPLWEMWMVEGLPGDEWAIVSKVHHCLADGVSGSDLLGMILDSSADAPAAATPPWTPQEAPSSWELAAGALIDMLTSPFELRRLARARLRVPRQLATGLAETVIGLAETAAGMRSPTDTGLNGPIGPHRRWVPASVPVATVKEVRRRFGGSFNDVVLALVTRGFRALLQHRGDPVGLPVRSMVPVSVRARDERGMAVGDGALANRVSAVFVELPVHVEDPVAALRSISAQMSDLKQSRRAIAGEALTALSGFAPPMLLSLACRVGTKVPQRTINTVTTNVPGPQFPLYAAGRRMLRIHPYVPLGIQMRIGVAIFSYDGTVGFGVTGDYNGAPDIAVLADGIESAAADLLGGDRSAQIIDLRPGGRSRASSTPSDRSRRPGR